MNKLHYFLSILSTLLLTFSLYATEQKNSNINSSKETNSDFVTSNNLKLSISEDDDYIVIKDTLSLHLSEAEKHDSIATKNRVASTFMLPLSHYFVSDKKKSFLSRMFKNKKEKCPPNLTTRILLSQKKKKILFKKLNKISFLI